MIRQVTIAPELPLALDLAVAIAVSGAIAAMGHTDATTEQATRRFRFRDPPCHAPLQRDAARYTTVTVGRSPPPFFKIPLTCELICDGAHVAPEPLSLAYRALGPAPPWW